VQLGAGTTQTHLALSHVGFAGNHRLQRCATR
jgi:hypothetical protein